jgi:hypothetical protein
VYRILESIDKTPLNADRYQNKQHRVRPVQKVRTKDGVLYRDHNIRCFTGRTEHSLQKKKRQILRSEAIATQQNNSCGAPSLLPHGGGLSIGGSADAGVPGPVGAADNGSAGVGAFAGGGAAAYAGGASASAVGGSRAVVAGPSAGVGVSGFITNVQSAQQLAGPFTTYSLNVGFGPIQGTISLSVGGGIHQLSVTPPLTGVSAASKVRTATVATGGCH